MGKGVHAPGLTCRVAVSRLSPLKLIASPQVSREAVWRITPNYRQRELPILSTLGKIRSHYCGLIGIREFSFQVRYRILRQNQARSLDDVVHVGPLFTTKYTTYTQAQQWGEEDGSELIFHVYERMQKLNTMSQSFHFAAPGHKLAGIQIGVALLHARKTSRRYTTRHVLRNIHTVSGWVPYLVGGAFCTNFSLTVTGFRISHKLSQPFLVALSGGLHCVRSVARRSVNRAVARFVPSSLGRSTRRPDVRPRRSVV